MATPEQINLALRRLIVLGCPMDACLRLRNPNQSKHFKTKIPPAIQIDLCTGAVHEEFIYLVLLTCWLDGQLRPQPKTLDVLEIFSGKARVSKMASWIGLEVRSIDINYDKPPKKESAHSGKQQRSAMDICGEAGFVLPGFCRQICFLFSMF